MVAFIEQKCVLARHFADFGMLPDLLALHPAEEGAQRPQTYPGDPDPLGMAPRWLRFLQNSGFNTDHIETDDLPVGPAMDYYLANDAWALALRLGLTGPHTLTEPGKRLARIGATPWEDRTEADDRAVEDIVVESIRTHYLGRDGTSVLDLVVSGAENLAATGHIWASYVPGLLLAEFEALIYWAFERPGYAVNLRDRLVNHRDVAMHKHGWPSPDVAPEDNLIRLADAVTDLYYDTEELAGRTELTVTEVRTTAMLLTFAGALEEFSMGPVNYLFPPRD